MPKNIIICCDGTNNKFGAKNSNVVQLYSTLESQPGRQIAYYDPGVGTLADTGLWGPIKKKMSVILGSAFGRGMQKNVEEAYSYLMEKYEEGDKIYLFGFSRGAYTVRVLAGFIKMLGLLEKGNQNLIPYAYEIYSDPKKQSKDSKVPSKFEIAGKFRYSYGREIRNYDENIKNRDGSIKKYVRNIKIHFMGLWDTVSSVGWVGNFHTYPFTDNNKDISIIRHALAIDERRTYFMNETLGTKIRDHCDVKEVWFAGVHSDVGGSYVAKESGLSKIALDWMIHEAAEAGVYFNENRYQYVVHHPKPNSKGENQDSPPNYKADQHESLEGVWKLAEVIPRTITVEYKPKVTKTFIPWGRRRIIPKGSILHRSVLERKNDSDLLYNPSNFPEFDSKKEYEPVEEYKVVNFANDNQSDQGFKNAEQE